MSSLKVDFDRQSRRRFSVLLVQDTVSVFLKATYSNIVDWRKCGFRDHLLCLIGCVCSRQRRQVWKGFRAAGADAGVEAGVVHRQLVVGPHDVRHGGGLDEALQVAEAREVLQGHRGRLQVRD